jgi:hypothetical protein
MEERNNILNKPTLFRDEFHSISQKIRKKPIFGFIIILFLYTIATILLTYPVAFTIGTHIPGGGDAFGWMNGLWYTNFALAHPEITSLTHNNMVFYPTGISAIPFSSAFNQIITLLLLPVCQIQVIYSLLWLLSFILAAFGAYLLVRYLTKSEYAAFLSGFIFAFTPYHFVHGLGHVGATTIQWIPFCALFFMKVFREGGIKNCVFAGIFYILVAMSDMQYLVFMGIFIAFLFLYENFVRYQDNRKFEVDVHKSILIKYLIVGVVAFSVILPLTFTDIQVASSGNNFLKPNPLEAITYSADLMSFFLPSVFHPIFGGTVAPVYHEFSGNYSEHTTYIGYTVLFLSVFALFVFRKNLIVRFWGIIALFFSLLSLGPVLHVAGRTVFTIFKISIPLPHLILYYLVPFLENSRTPGRFFIVAALAFSVLAGYGCSELLKRYGTKKIIIVILLCGLIIFEYLSIPFPISPADQPAFYQKIGQDPEQFALLEIPNTANYFASMKIIYYQIIHGKPIVGGQYARMSAYVRDFEKNTPFVNQLSFLRPQQEDIFDLNVTEAGNSILANFNIRYVILHTSYLTPDQITNLTSILTPALGEPAIFKNDSLIIYAVEKEPRTSFLTLNEGWHSIEMQSGIPKRWINSNATFTVYSTENKNVLINLQAASFNRERTLRVSTEKFISNPILIPTHFIPVSIPVTLEAGKNNIRLNISEGCEIPNSFPKLNSNDTRCLSLAIQDITIS